MAIYTKFGTPAEIINVAEVDHYAVKVRLTFDDGKTMEKWLNALDLRADNGIREIDDAIKKLKGGATDPDLYFALTGLIDQVDVMLDLVDKPDAIRKVYKDAYRIRREQLSAALEQARKVIAPPDGK